jgi:hypothetical protein
MNWGWNSDGFGMTKGAPPWVYDPYGVKGMGKGEMAEQDEKEEIDYVDKLYAEPGNDEEDDNEEKGEGEDKEENVDLQSWGWKGDPFASGPFGKGWQGDPFASGPFGKGWKGDPYASGPMPMMSGWMGDPFSSKGFNPYSKGWIDPYGKGKGKGDQEGKGEKEETEDGDDKSDRKSRKSRGGDEQEEEPHVELINDVFSHAMGGGLEKAAEEQDFVVVRDSHDDPSWLSSKKEEPEFEPVSQPPERPESLRNIPQSMNVERFQEDEQSQNLPVSYTGSQSYTSPGTYTYTSSPVMSAGMLPSAGQFIQSSGYQAPRVEPMFPSGTASSLPMTEYSTHARTQPLPAARGFPSGTFQPQTLPAARSLPPGTLQPQTRNLPAAPTITMQPFGSDPFGSASLLGSMPPMPPTSGSLGAPTFQTQAYSAPPKSFTSLSQIPQEVLNPSFGYDETTMTGPIQPVRSGGIQATPSSLIAA